MDTIPLNPPKKAPALSSTARLLTLQAMVPVAANLAASQLEAFSGRLADALFKVSDQAVHPEEANTCFHSFQLLKRNSSTFYRLVAGQINSVLSKEVSAVNVKKKANNLVNAEDFSLVSFEEMESKVLMRNLSQSLELSSSEQLVALNARIGHILGRDPINVSQNPFRPESFVRAVHLAWMEFDSNTSSHQIVLRLLQPEIFLQLNPILQEINETLANRGVLPNINQSYREAQRKQSARRSDSLSTSDPYLRNKLKSFFSESGRPTDGGGYGSESSAAIGAAIGFGSLNSGGVGSNSGGGSAGQSAAGPNIGAQNGTSPAGTVVVDKQFFDYLTSIQRQPVATPFGGLFDGSPLRQLAEQSSSGNLSHIEQNTIELLARIFEFVFNDPGIPEDLKNLIGNLQIPTLRAALLDKDFFFSETHPARVLIDTLAKSSIFLDAESADADPLYQVMEGIVDRVQQEFDQQIELFSDVVSDLEAFLKEEELKTQQAIQQPVEEALKAEKQRLAREFAENDVSLRVETGEVPRFLEAFLADQWTRILTVAHSVKDEKPQALENALKTMDDLIWSLKPKNSAEERKELISKLPAMLTLLNAWLNAIKWDEPERVIFFSKLAERHAGIARAPLELSPRRQVEIAVNIAQRASERQLDRHEQDRKELSTDAWDEVLQSLERGVWIDFVRKNGSTTRFKLAWVSPKRTRFIFTNRQGHDAFSIASDELLAKLRDGTAVQIVAGSVVDRALVEALRETEH